MRNRMAQGSLLSLRAGYHVPNMVWPSISLETANRLYLWGWYGSLFGAAVTALSVCILMLGTRVRDRDAELQMTRANTAAAQANVRAGNLEVQAATLNKEAEQAKLEQERLKAQLAWRVIPPETLAKLHARLRQLDGSVLFAFPSSDNEAQYLAIQLAKTFENTRWKMGTQSRTYANAVIFGIVIPGPVTQDVLKLREAFVAAGIPFSTNDLPAAGFTGSGGMVGPAATVFVGSKPPPAV
jgi:hypothetical protein